MSSNHAVWFALVLQVFHKDEFSNRLSFPSAVRSPFLTLILQRFNWALGPPLSRPEF